MRVFKALLVLVLAARVGGAAETPLPEGASNRDDARSNPRQKGSSVAPTDEDKLGRASIPTASPADLEAWNAEHLRLIAAEKNLAYLQASIEEARAALVAKIAAMEAERLRTERAELVRQTKGYLQGFPPEKQPPGVAKEMPVWEAQWGRELPKPKRP